MATPKSMATAKKKKDPVLPSIDPALAATERANVEAMDATRGAPTNVRAGGPMEDRRTKRRRTRAAQNDAAIEES